MKFLISKKNTVIVTRKEQFVHKLMEIESKMQLSNFEKTVAAD